SAAWHKRAALSTTDSSTGSISVGEREITFRISAVAVCCSRASVSKRCRSAYDCEGWELLKEGRRGVPHSPQNLCAAGLSCWHRGHCMPPSECGPVKVRTGGARLAVASPSGQLPEVSSGSRLVSEWSCLDRDRPFPDN